MASATTYSSAEDCCHAQLLLLTTVLPVLTVLRTARITTAADRASRPAGQQMRQMHPCYGLSQHVGPGSFCSSRLHCAARGSKRRVLHSDPPALVDNTANAGAGLLQGLT